LRRIAKCAEKRNVSFNPLRRGSFSVSCDSKTINQQPRGNDSLSLTIGHGLKVRRSGELWWPKIFFTFRRLSRTRFYLLRNDEASFARGIWSNCDEFAQHE
jgi:hypothetical protein